MPERITGTAPERARLDVVVTALVPDISRSRAAGLIKGGNVQVGDQVVTRPATKVSAGDSIIVDVPPPAPSETVAQDLPLHIVFQDPDIAVINKAAGMVVHPGAGHGDGTLVNALLHHIGDLSGIGGVERPGIVHRLDKGTSGLMVVAKHDLAHRHLAAQFAAHTAGRRYLALCAGNHRRSEGTIESNLARHPKDRVRWASTRDGSGKRAVTHWWRRAQQGTVCLIECKLETGRTHQVRIHLSEVGLPLLGDPMYGKRARVPASIRDRVTDDRPLLHAWKLVLEHPSTGETLEFEVEPPGDFREVLETLGIEL